MSKVASALMNSASAGWDMACRTVGACRFGPPVDRESGTMVTGDACTVPRLFSYVRHGPELGREGMVALGLAHICPEDVQKLDSVDYMEQLRAIGQAYVQRSFDLVYFKHFIQGRWRSA